MWKIIDLLYFRAIKSSAGFVGGGATATFLTDASPTRTLLCAILTAVLVYMSPKNSEL